MPLMVRGVAGLCTILVVAPAVPAAPQVIEGESFTFPLPDGYRDITEEIRKSGFARKQVSVQAKAPSKGTQPTIVFQLAPIWGGTMGDPKVCRQSAESMAGPSGKVKSASIIPGPEGKVWAGKICQMHVVTPEGVALITELVSYTETWLMTCNHADGDAAAEKVCRSTLAAFKFKEVRRAAAKIDLPPIGVRECDDYLRKFVACLSQRLSNDEIGPARVLLKVTAEGWRKLAASEDGRKSLPAACTKTLADTKAITRTAGCEW